MNDTEETVKQKLESNTEFWKLVSESEPYHLYYNIGGNKVVLFNSVGGYAEAFLVPPFDMNTIYEACEFAIIARKLLSQIINK
ncbi:MAG: hypothetical protein Q4E26_01635 [Prevotellaceae bacterium]|nr:hypothetical protein [Prevotellaceae bacterium]